MVGPLGGDCRQKAKIDRYIENIQRDVCTRFVVFTVGRVDKRKTKEYIKKD